MVGFKLCISDPSTKKTFQKEVKDSMAAPFIGMNIGETVKGDNFDLAGYELQITGGSDYCGFPMRKGILGQRKKIAIYGGVGYRAKLKGIKERKTVCGHKIHERISQVNLKVLKQGQKKLAEIFGIPEEAKKEAKPEKAVKKAEEHKEMKAEEPKEKNTEAKEVNKEHKAHVKEHAPEEKKHETHPKEHKEEKHTKAEEKKE